MYMSVSKINPLPHVDMMCLTLRNTFKIHRTCAQKSELNHILWEADPPIRRFVFANLRIPLNRRCSKTARRMSQHKLWILNKGLPRIELPRLPRDSCSWRGDQKWFPEKKDWSVRLSRLHETNSKFYWDFGTVIRLGVGEPVVKLIRQSNGAKENFIWNIHGDSYDNQVHCYPKSQK